MRILVRKNMATIECGVYRNSFEESVGLAKVVGLGSN